MTLEEWKDSKNMMWRQVARELTGTGFCTVYDNRLNSLRMGRKPTSDELKALLHITNNEVDSFI